MSYRDISSHTYISTYLLIYKYLLLQPKQVRRVSSKAKTTKTEARREEPILELLGMKRSFAALKALDIDIGVYWKRGLVMGAI